MSNQVDIIGTVVAANDGTLVVLVGLKLSVYWVLTDDPTIGVLDTVHVVGERVLQEVVADSVTVVNKFDPHTANRH